MSCLAPRGRLDDARDQMQLAQSLDPVSAIIARDLTMVHYYRRDFEAALDQCDHTIELEPHFSPAYWTLGLIQEQRKDFDESAAAFQRAVYLSPHSPRMHGALGRTFALSGKRKLALGILSKLRQLSKRRYVSPFEFASIHFALGQADLGIPLAGQGVPGPGVRADGDQGGPALRRLEGRPEVRRADPGDRLELGR